jgi:signal transduction histidine kinase
MVQVTETASFSAQAAEINQALLISSIRQQELTASTERLNQELQDVIEERDEDLIKQKELAAQLRSQAKELTEADRRKSEFLATLAHELRNPLAPLRSGLELLNLMGGDHDERDRTHAMMTRQVDHMVRLIDELMDLSRITSGVVHLQLEPVDVLAALAEALESSRPFREGQRHELLVDLPEHPLYVNGDGLRLNQVFTNLLNNAAKYTDHGGMISVHATVVGQEVVVSVEDNGIGIAANHLGRVFDMFSQVDHTHGRGQGGLGIGLHIVKYLVEMHHGRIEVRSPGLGFGSSFTVHLPLITARTEKEAVATAPPEDPSGSVALRILVVDDNADAAAMMAIILGKCGHEVHVAHNGAKALEMGGRVTPDVVLMDLGMPVMDGCTACQQMRRTEWGRAATIIALTGWGQAEDRRKTPEAGFTHHLVKPIDMNELRSVLAAHDRSTG